MKNEDLKKEFENLLCGWVKNPSIQKHLIDLFNQALKAKENEVLEWVRGESYERMAGSDWYSDQHFIICEILQSMRDAKND